MGYSTSPRTLERILDKLAPLAEGKSTRWETAPGQAERWAYRVREALSIALLYPDRFPALAKHASHYTVEVVAGNAVQAVYAANTAEVAVVQHVEPVPRQGQTVHSKPGAPIVVAGVRTAFDIIDYWLRAQPTNDPLRFPDALLDAEELDRLAAWANTLTPRWMVLKAQHEDAITLMKHDPRVPEGARWNPPAK
jgi:hypothetical protein